MVSCRTEGGCREGGTFECMRDAASTHAHGPVPTKLLCAADRKKKEADVAACAPLIAADGPSPSSESLLQMSRVGGRSRHSTPFIPANTKPGAPPVTFPAETEAFVRTPRVADGSHRKIVWPKIFMFVLILDPTLWKRLWLPAVISRQKTICSSEHRRNIPSVC